MSTGFAVVGVRNFAATHIENIGKLEEKGEGIKLTGVVIKNQIKNLEKTRELRGRGVKIFDSYEDLLRNGKGHVDVISLPVGIPDHAPMAAKAMRAGFDVLLEKPPAPTVDQIDKLMEIERKTGRFCSIGFQFIHSRSIRRLKSLLIEGKIGRIKDIATKGYWPRFRSYYDRNPWAGKSILEGRLVLDGPMHNALAHYLNNMIFLASSELDRSAKLKTVRAELYRGHSYIEADDTSCLQAETADGIQINFYVNHTSREMENPYMEIRGEKGKATWRYDESTSLELESGEKMEFGNQGVDPWLEVLRVTAAVHREEISKPYCNLENCRSFVVAINGAYESSRYIRSIPSDFVEEYETEQGEFKTVVEGIGDKMDRAFEGRKTLSEIGVSWAEETPVVDVEDYDSFSPFEAV